MKIIGDNIFITVEKKPTQSGSIIIGGEDAEVSRYAKGVVYDIGNATKPQVDELRIGDEIYFQKSAGYEILIQEASYLVVSSSDVVLIV
jgi:co-chaperonin GroES (HSP10)